MSKEQLQEVVWVMGPAAAGKETFIRFVERKPQADVRTLLGWIGKIVSACEPSIRHIWLGEGVNPMPEREEILSDVARILVGSNVALIKWHLSDRYTHRPERLKESLPDAYHRAIVLQPGIQESARRVTEKLWWPNEKIAPDLYAAEEELLVWVEAENLRDGAGFDLTVLGSNTMEEYPVIDPAKFMTV